MMNFFGLGAPPNPRNRCFYDEDLIVVRKAYTNQFGTHFNVGDQFIVVLQMDNFVVVQKKKYDELMFQVFNEEFNHYDCYRTGMKVQCSTVHSPAKMQYGAITSVVPFAVRLETSWWATIGWKDIETITTDNFVEQKIHPDGDVEPLYEEDTFVDKGITNRARMEANDVIDVEEGYGDENLEGEEEDDEGFPPHVLILAMVIALVICVAIAAFTGSFGFGNKQEIEEMFQKAIYDVELALKAAVKEAESKWNTKNDCDESKIKQTFTTEVTKIQLQSIAAERNADFSQRKVSMIDYYANQASYACVNEVKIIEQKFKNAIDEVKLTLEDAVAEIEWNTMNDCDRAKIKTTLTMKVTDTELSYNAVGRSAEFSETKATLVDTYTAKARENCRNEVQSRKSEIQSRKSEKVEESIRYSEEWVENDMHGFIFEKLDVKETEKWIFKDGEIDIKIKQSFELRIQSYKSENISKRIGKQVEAILKRQEEQWLAKYQKKIEEELEKIISEQLKTILEDKEALKDIQTWSKVSVSTQERKFSSSCTEAIEEGLKNQKKFELLELKHIRMKVAEELVQQWASECQNWKRNLVYKSDLRWYHWLIVIGLWAGCIVLILAYTTHQPFGPTGSDKLLVLIGAIISYGLTCFFYLCADASYDFLTVSLIFHLVCVLTWLVITIAGGITGLTPTTVSTSDYPEVTAGTSASCICLFWVPFRRCVNQRSIFPCCDKCKCWVCPPFCLGAEIETKIHDPVTGNAELSPTQCCCSNRWIETKNKLKKEYDIEAKQSTYAHTKSTEIKLWFDKSNVNMNDSSRFDVTTNDSASMVNSIQDFSTAGYDYDTESKFNMNFYSEEAYYFSDENSYLNAASMDDGVNTADITLGANALAISACVYGLVKFGRFAYSIYQRNQN